MNYQGSRLSQAGEENTVESMESLEVVDMKKQKKVYPDFLWISDYDFNFITIVN